jgi:hypothetical protein
MALTKCKECGKDISTEAKACPSCGAPPPPRTSTATWIIGGFFALTVVVWISTANETRQRTPAPAQETAEQVAARKAASLRNMAIVGCAEFAKQKLHDPASAQFAPKSEATLELNGSRAVVVRSVRAKNAFGAMRLTEFVCMLEVNEKEVRSVIVAERGQETQASQAFTAQWLKAGK